MEWYWLILLGLSTGVLGIIVGAGGGFVLGPVLLMFTDLEPKFIAGTVLALVAINTIVGSRSYIAMGTVDLRSALLFAIVATPTAVVSPFLVGFVDPGLFRTLFGGLLIFIGIRLLFKSAFIANSSFSISRFDGLFANSTRPRVIASRDGATYRYEFNEIKASTCSFGLGFISSFFGTGMGFILTPLLVYGFSFPVKVAVGTSIASMAVYTTVGTVTHVFLGNIQWWPTFVMAGIGLIIGSQIGTQVAKLVKGSWIMGVLTILILAMGIRLILLGMWS